MRYLTVFKILFVLCLVLLTYLLLIEMAPVHDGSLYKDKFQHIVAFGGVTFWGVLAFHRYSLLTTAGLAVFGAVMEVLQGLLTTTRQPSVYDWVADVVGILLAWGVVILLQRWQAKRRALDRG